MSPAPLHLAKTLARAFQALARDLLFPSESDFPYKAFAAPFAKDARLSPEAFRDAAGIGRRYEIEVRPAAPFFEQHTSPADGDHTEVARYLLLERVMNATLADLSLVRVGGGQVVRVRVYLVGTMEDGNLAGLSTVSIET